MYAVMRTGGKQYRVATGDILEVEKLEGNVGDSITLNDVLLVSQGDNVTIGQPTIDGVNVHAKITGQYRGKKIRVFKYRPKKRIRVRKGHRQYLTRLEIQGIYLPGEEVPSGNGASEDTSAVETEAVNAVDATVADGGDNVATEQTSDDNE